MLMHWTGEVTPIAFSIGNVSVAWYGIVITVGMLVSLALCMQRLQRVDIKKDDTLTLFVVCIPAAIICARLGYVLSHYKMYFVSPYDWDAFVNTIAIWRGGLTVMWGVPGGVLAGLVFCKINKKDFIRAADMVLPTVLIAQVIGRWGNFFNQELYGQMVTDTSMQWFPYAVFIADEGAWFQATFFYEGVLNAIGFALLMWLTNHLDIKGLGILGYPAWYCMVRGCLEFIRDDGVNAIDNALGFNTVQVLCFVVSALCIAAIVYLAVRQKKKGKQIYYKKIIPSVQPKREKSPELSV